MKPPGNVQWEESPVLIGDALREAFLVKSDDSPLALKFVVDHWHWSYSQRASLFIHFPPKVMGEPVGFAPDGRPIYRPISPPAEVWFLTGVTFQEVWEFARVKGFANSSIPPAVRDACEAFLRELAARHPIGLEAVGDGWASFRRYSDGGAFDLPEMRRAWDLNMAIFGGPQDASHLDPGMPRRFVRDGFFYFGQ